MQEFRRIEICCILGIFTVQGDAFPHHAIYRIFREDAFILKLNEQLSQQSADGDRYVSNLH